MTRPRWAAAALLVAVFAIGVLAGAGLMAARGHGSAFSARLGPGTARYLETLTDTLRLSPAQQDSVRAVLNRRTPAMDSLWREIGPRYARLRETIRSEIRSHLTADQRGTYTEILRHHDAERRRRP